MNFWLTIMIRQRLLRQMVQLYYIKSSMHQQKTQRGLIRVVKHTQEEPSRGTVLRNDAKLQHLFFYFDSCKKFVDGGCNEHFETFRNCLTLKHLLTFSNSGHCRMYACQNGCVAILAQGRYLKRSKTSSETL